MQGGFRWLAAAVVALPVLVLWAWPVLFDPTGAALGSPYSEGPGHLWGLWTTAGSLPSAGPLVRDAAEVGFPDGFYAHLMDPINLILFVPGFLLGGGGPTGATLGWNLLHVGSLVVAAAGCVVLGRQVAPEHPWAVAVLTAGFVANAFFLAHPHMGRTEYLPAVLWPWHLAALTVWVRGGTWRSGVLAGLSLGAIALGGTYLTVFLAFLEVPAALVVAWGQPWRGALGRLALTAGLGVLVALPGAVALVVAPPTGVLSLGSPGLPVAHAETAQVLTSLLHLQAVPGLDSKLDQVAYPGIVLLGVAIFGAVRRPRAALPWLAVATWGLALALGPWWSPWRDGPFLPGPALALDLVIPPLRNIQHWERIACLAALPLAIAATLGVTSLGGRLRGWAIAVVAIAAVADQATWPRNSLRGPPTYTVAAPDDLLTALASLPEGAILEAPLQVSVAPGITLKSGFYLLWARQHPHPVSATPAVSADRALSTSFLARLLVNRQFELSRKEAGRARLPGADGRLSAAHLECVRGDVTRMRQAGFSGVVLHRDERMGPELLSLLGLALGPPTGERGGVAVWDLTAVPEGDARCDLPSVPPKIRTILRTEDQARP